MSFPSASARTPRDTFAFRGLERLVYGGSVRFFEVTGLWKHPIRASGDFEEMKLLDKIYWLYKAQNPITRPPRGSGLERYFARHALHDWQLPIGFRPQYESALSAVGDLMNHEFLANSRDSLYRDVADLVFDVDVAMGNLECVVLPTPSGQLRFSTTDAPPLFLGPDEFDVLRSDGTRQYSFLAAACNHSLDFGEEGVASTIEALRSKRIAFHGVNETERDAAEATVVTARDIRIGVVSYCFGLNAKKPPAHRPSIVNRVRLNAAPAGVDFTLVDRQLAHCRAAGVDFVVAQLHWGMEYELYPRPEQVELAHVLAEKGVDAIFGHHPHVVQPFECYRTRRDPSRVVPIYYSLGNLTNPFAAPYLCRSSVARLSLAKGTGDDGSVRTYVSAARVHDVIQVANHVERTLSILRAEPA